MSNGKHTPGPWNFRQDPDFGTWTIFADGKSIMGNEKYYPWVPSDAADWQLIAAAPELLAFAQGFLADYQSEDGMASMKHYAKQAHALIAKATGEQA